MKIEEAIIHALDTSKNMDECKSCRDEHKQLAKWLKELKQIKDILGDDYDLDRLRELVEADRDGRCYITNVKIGERIFVPDKDEKVVGCRVQGISLPAHGKNLIIHLGGYPAEYIWSDREGIDWWKTHEAAEAALKGENDA